MRSFIVLAATVVIVSGGIWLVSSNPQAKERLQTDAKVIKMDIDAMTRKAGNLQASEVDSFM